MDNPILLLANYARNKEYDKIRIGSYGDRARVFTKVSFDEECIFNSDQIICSKNATVRSLNKFYRSQYLGFNDMLIRDNDKVMCLNNNWGTDNGEGFSLVNGLIGTASNIVIKPKAKLYELDFKPEFTKAFENVVIDKLLFEGKEIDDMTELMRLPLSDSINKPNEFIHAYAITTHKSQGSEFPYVTLFPEVINRNDHFRLLYTGITRASENLDIIL